MDLRNCPSCGKLFVYTVRNLCPNCIKEDEHDFNKVRDYLYDNPEATIEDVTAETGVDSKKVLEYLKEGRLMLKSNNPNLLTCESCNEPILTGKFCDKCAADMKRQFSATLFPKNEDMKGKLHLSKYQRDQKRGR